MYLVSPEHFRNKTQLAQPHTSIKKASRKPPLRHKRKKKRHVTEKQHPYDKLVMFRKKIEETDMKREALIKEIANILGRVLPKNKLLQKLPSKNEPLETSVQHLDNQKKRSPLFLNFFAFQ